MMKPMPFILIAVGIVLVGIGIALYWTSDVGNAVDNYYGGAEKQILELKDLSNFEIFEERIYPVDRGPHLNALKMSAELNDPEKLLGLRYEMSGDNAIIERVSYILVDNLPADAEARRSFEYPVAARMGNERVLFGDEKIEVWPYKPFKYLENLKLTPQEKEALFAIQEKLRAMGENPDEFYFSFKSIAFDNIFEYSIMHEFSLGSEINGNPSGKDGVATYTRSSKEVTFLYAQ